MKRLFSPLPPRSGPARALLLLLLLSHVPAAAGGREDEAFRRACLVRLPESLRAGLSLAATVHPGNPAPAAPGEAPYRVAALSLAAPGGPAAEAEGGEARLDPAGRRLFARLDLARVSLRAVPLLAALAERTDLPELAAGTLRGEATLTSTRERIDLSFRLADGPRAISGDLSLGDGFGRGTVRVAWRLRALPPAARFPRALQTALGRREATFHVERSGDVWRIASPEERALLELASGDPAPPRGETLAPRLSRELASGSANPALRLLHVALGPDAPPEGVETLTPLPCATDPAVSLAEAGTRAANRRAEGASCPPLDLVRFVAEAAGSAPARPHDVTLPPQIARALRYRREGTLDPARLAPLPATLALALAWEIRGRATLLPDSPATRRTRDRFTRAAAASLSAALLERGERVAAADPAVRREREALLGFAALLGRTASADGSLGEDALRRLALLRPAAPPSLAKPRATR